MKKLLISLVLAVACVGTVMAQKSYVNVVADHIYSSIYQEIYLTGDVPVGIKTHYDSYGSEAMTMGKVLNLLANEGFIVEQMSCSAECEVVLLSRVQVYPPDSDAIERITFKGMVNAFFVDESLRFDAVFGADVEVIEAMVRVGMDAARARFLADESRAHDEGVLIGVDGLLADDAFEILAMEGFMKRAFLELEFGLELFC